MPLPCIEIETAPNPHHAVIWLHGLGADGHDFEPIVPELVDPRLAALRFVFPTCAGAADHDQRRHADARVVRHLRHGNRAAPG